jgi:hypothetical protein
MTLWIIIYKKTIDESKMLPPLTTRYKIYLFMVDILVDRWSTLWDSEFPNSRFLEMMSAQNEV